jgi:anaerobic magnesium-protoporphyrin IX monomethyl ester cyclase
MRSLLLNVPVYAVSSPLLPISKLVASLRSKGVSNIAQADLNLSCLEYFARPEVYTEVLDTLEREIATGQTKQREGKPRLEDVVVAGRSVEGEVEQAFEVFRSPDRFSDWSSHRRALTVYRVFNLVLDAAFPLEWSWTASGDDLEAIDTFTKLRDFQDAERNPFRRYFEYELRRGLIGDETGVVGISVLYQQQLFPAFTLAKLIRERYPHVTIVFGGSMISLLEQYILRMKTFFEYAHAYVLYEGEGPLHALIESVEAGRGIPNVMNIVRLERDRIVGDRDIKAFPFEYLTPSFDGLPLDRYLSPRLILRQMQLLLTHPRPGPVFAHVSRSDRANVGRVVRPLWSERLLLLRQCFAACTHQRTLATFTRLGYRVWLVRRHDSVAAASARGPEAGATGRTEDGLRWL